MNALKQVRPAAWGLLYVSLICLGLGLGLRRYRTERELLNRVRTRLDGVTERIGETERTEAEIRRRFDRPAVGLAELLEAYPPGGTREVVEASAVALPMGLRHRTAEVHFGEWSWEDVRRTVMRAGEQTPPWRLTGLEIAAGLEGLEGTLRLEALDKDAERP